MYSNDIIVAGALHLGRDPDGELRAGGHRVQAPLVLKIYLFINIYLINNRMLQILQIYHAGSRVDGPSQVTVASSFLIILLQKSSSPLQVPISNPLLPDYR